MASSKAQFIKADIINWDDLVAAFEAAVQNSPKNRLDIVISNAGIIGNDDMSSLEGISQANTAPDID